MEIENIGTATLLQEFERRMERVVEAFNFHFKNGERARPWRYKSATVNKDNTIDIHFLRYQYGEDETDDVTIPSWIVDVGGHFLKEFMLKEYCRRAEVQRLIDERNREDQYNRERAQYDALKKKKFESVEE
jgi:hypothetical protein